MASMNSSGGGKSLGASIRSNRSVKSNGSNEYDLKAVKTKSSECPPYEGDGLSMASLGLTKEQAAKHCVHWQACPNFSSLYGDGGELNVPPPSNMSEDGSTISHAGVSYERTGSGKYRAANGESLPGSALGAIFQNESCIKFGGVSFERTDSGHFISKDGQTLSQGAMAQIFGGFATNGDLGGFDNFNIDGSMRAYVNPYANMPFGRFAAIDAIVAEGQNRMALKKKMEGIEAPEPPKPKPKYNPTFDSSRIGSHPMTPESKSEYKSEYAQSYSADERMKSSERMKSGEIYKVVCDNLKQNLKMIENYEKDPAEALRQQFQAFASFGKDRHKDGSHITLSQIDRWFKQAEVIDGDRITTTDTAILFKKTSGSCPWLTFREFLKFLEMFAEEHHLKLNELKKKLGVCGEPATTNHTEVDTAPVVNRLTDVSTYPSTHNQIGQQPQQWATKVM